MNLAIHNFLCLQLRPAAAASRTAEEEKKEEEGLQGVFKRLHRNGHQLEKGLQMAQRRPSLK
jgi:hypothetical protein